MISRLDLEAHLGSEYLHPGGLSLSRRLLSRFRDDAAGRRVLELGCGTGATAALAVRETGCQLVALEFSPAMLAAAGRRRDSLRAGGNTFHLVRAHAGRMLPFADGVFSGVYAESVVALLDVESVLAECARVLQPGGWLWLNERVWRPGVSLSAAEQINAISLAAFSIPAALPAGLDAGGWQELLRSSGFQDVEVWPVDRFLPRGGEPDRRPAQRRQRARLYLRKPGLLLRSLHFKAQARRNEELWRQLASYVFLARKPVSAGTDRDPA